MKIRIKPAKILINIDIQRVYPELEDLEVTPTTEEQNFKSNKYGFDNVKVKRIETEELNIIPSTEEQVNEGLYSKVTVAGDNNLLPENIKSGTSIFGVEGTAKITNMKITDASYLFNQGARTDYLNELLSLCEGITSAYAMFQSSKITELDVSNLDTSNVTTMRYMFSGCNLLTELDVSNLDTSNVTDMSNMFANINVTNLNVSNFDTSKVTTMYYMFNSCTGITELDVSNFDTSNVTNISYMFNSCTGLTELDVSNFDMSKVVNVVSMFASCSKLTNLSSFKNLGKSYKQKTNNYSNYKLDLSQSNKLTRESLLDVITKGLYDLNLTYDVANGGTLYRQSLILGPTNLAKLTEEEIAIATNKGWDVT